MNTEEFQQNRANMIRTLEEKRQRYFRIYTMGIPMSFAASAAIAALNMNGNPFPWPIVTFITLAITIIGFQVVNFIYRKQTKKAFLEGIAESLGLSYHPNGAFPLEDVASHKIIPPFDRGLLEDGFTGTVSGISIAFQEAHLVDVTPAQKREDPDREDTVFWGIMIRIGIGKNLDAHTVVIPRNALQKFFYTTLSKFKKVNLVSPKFEERFDVMGTDQVEARYVLDPAFIERFMEAGDSLGTKWIEASFKGREIFLAVNHNRPMFEIGMLWKPLNEDSLGAVTKDIQTILDLIAVLKLNPHTGLGAELPKRT